MPNQQPTYREQVDAQRIIQIREILKGLPQACGDFIRSIAVTTGTFTRWHMPSTYGRSSHFCSASASRLLIRR